MGTPGFMGGGGKLEDDRDHDFTTAALPARPCQRCGERPWDLPHSVCVECHRKARAGKTNHVHR